MLEKMLGLVVQKIYPKYSNIYTKYPFEKINYIWKHWYKKGFTLSGFKCFWPKNDKVQNS